MWQHLVAVDWTSTVPVVGVGAAAAVASFDSLRKFAVAVGWPTATAWLLPFCLDLYAVMALRLWLRTDVDERTRNWAARSGWLAVALSVAGNAVQHAVSLGYWTAYHEGVRTPHLTIVVIVAAVPPVMLALLIHLESMRRTSHSAQNDAAGNVLPAPAGSSTAAEEINDPEPRPITETIRRKRQGTSKQREKVAALLSSRSGAITANAYELGGELAAEVGGHPQTVRRYVRQWQQAQRHAGQHDEAGVEVHEVGA